MSQTLSEIVSSALRQADQSIKVASLREAPIEDRGFARVDDFLARELGQVHVEEQKIASAAPLENGPTFAGYDDVDFAFKLAEALQHGAVVVEKLAEGGMDRPLNKSDGGMPTAGGTPPGGPAPVFPHNYDNALTTTPIPQASAHARRAQANERIEPGGGPETDRDLQLNDGPVVPSNYPTSRLPTTGATTKKASLDRALTQRLLRSKIAQHKMLVSLGQVDAANAVLKEAQELASTTDSGLVFGDTYNNAIFPDNEQVRAMTKAQARDRNQREAGSFFGEPVKRDSAALAHLAVADGLKLSASTSVSDALIQSESSTSIAKAPIVRGGTEAIRHPVATQTRNPPASIQGVTPELPNAEREEALARIRAAKTAGLLEGVGNKVIGAAQWGTRKAMHGAGSVARRAGSGRAAKGTMIGPQQQGWLEQTANSTRQGLGGAHKAMNQASTGTRELVGGGTLAVGGGGALYGGHRLMSGGRRDPYGN